MRRRVPIVTRRNTAETCPSAPAKEGALLIGVFVAGRTAFLHPAVRVTASDLEGVGEDVDRRFRFAMPCQHGGCHNFENHQCGLVERLIAESSDCAGDRDAVTSSELPNCAIRPTCAWFSVAGARACSICPSVLRP